MIILSPVQQRTLRKLLAIGGWVNAYQLRERVNTLDILVRKGYAQEKRRLGVVFDPTVNIKYRAHPLLRR